MQKRNHSINLLLFLLLAGVYGFCYAVCRLWEPCGMVQVMDQSQASGQIQLFTELHSRFPEVPVDVIKFIMQQVCLLYKLRWMSSLIHWITVKCVVVIFMAV